MKFNFSATSPLLKQLRSAGGFRLELDLTENEYHQFSGLSSPELKGEILEVSIEVSETAPVPTSDNDQF